MNEPSLKGWHFHVSLKCPRCGKLGLLRKENDEDPQYAIWWCIRGYDHNGCGWKGRGIGHPMYSTEIEKECRHLSVKEIFDLEVDLSKVENCYHHWHLLGSSSDSGEHYYRKCCWCGTTNDSKTG